MNKKIFFLVLLQICLFATQSFAQTCYNTSVSCLAASEQQVNLTGSNWHASHGDVATIISNNNAPTSPTTTGSLSLWAFDAYNLGTGAFTCFKFQQGRTYKVCYWVRNTSGMFGDPPNPWGRLKVYAADGMYANYNPGMFTLPTVNKQLIDQSYYGPAQYEADAITGEFEWEFISATFTADDDYTNLWIYPSNPMGFPAPGSLFWHLEYTVEVDDIRVEDITNTTPPTLTVTPTGSIINGCNDPVTLTVNGMPSNYVAKWTPAVTQVTSNWSQVIASPCNFTIYKIEITDPSSSCPNCVKEVRYDTVWVNRVSDPANVIINPVSPVPCTTTFSLDYNNTSSCTPMHYVWIDPTGTPHPCFPANNPYKSFTADASLTGEWTLKILYMGKTCYEEIKFDVVVGSCCISNPGFTSNAPSNPITFNNTSTGITNQVASLWNFGDGTMSDATNPVHSYNNTQPEVYYVCLTVLYTDGQGETCCSQFCDYVTVDPNTNACVVSADFDYAAVSGWGNMFDFIDASSGSGTICDYEWDFGDGQVQTTTLPTIRHQYASSGPAGPWRVCLTVTNCVYDANGILVATCKNKKCIMVNPVVSAVPGLRTQPRVTEPQSATNSINEQSNEKVLTVYPNPNQGSFILSLRKHSGNYRVVLRDKQGREVYNHEHEFGNGSAHIILGDIANGTYTVEVVNDNDKFVQQIVIAK